MLKIKDDISLKELEKFGFINCDYIYHLSIDDYNYINVYIYSKALSMICLNNEQIEDIIFDLIQLGLVEKVEEIRKYENNNIK